MILDRNDAIAARQDPYGKSWGVRVENEERSFWIVCVKSPSGELVVPSTYPTSELEGKFTKISYALEALSAYLGQAWDMSDAATLKQAQKPHKLKETAIV